MTNHRKIIMTVIVLLMIGAFAGNANSVSANTVDSSRSLTIALLPIPDVLPFHLAQEYGYFKAEGITVEALPVASALDRDQLMQAGKLDAMLTELATTANFNRNGVRVKIVCIARSPIAGSPLFRILSAPGSGIITVAELAGVPVAVSKNTIIEYVTDRLLLARGLSPKDIIKESVPVIPERYQLLLQGQIKAATLPEPLASSALAAGAGQIVEDSAYPQYSLSVISFSAEALNKKPETVRAFLRAWNRAVLEINVAPDVHRPLLLKKIRVPKNVSHNISIPRFPRNRVPDTDQWADVMDWMISKGLLTRPLAYRDSVTPEFLPANTK